MQNKGNWVSDFLPSWSACIIYSNTLHMIRQLTISVCFHIEKSRAYIVINAVYLFEYLNQHQYCFLFYNFPHFSICFGCLHFEFAFKAATAAHFHILLSLNRSSVSVSNSHTVRIVRVQTKHPTHRTVSMTALRFAAHRTIRMNFIGIRYIY